MAETPEFDFERAAPVSRVLSVGELTERIKSMLGGLGQVAVEGEVTGLKRASSGHVYFGLKDRARGVESVAAEREQSGDQHPEPADEHGGDTDHGDRVQATGPVDRHVGPPRPHRCHPDQ